MHTLIGAKLKLMETEWRLDRIMDMLLMIRISTGSTFQILTILLPKIMHRL